MLPKLNADFSQSFVEQKNGSVVREYVGHDRLEGAEEQAMLAQSNRSAAKRGYMLR